MNKEPRWIPRQAIIDLHKGQIAEHGGLEGIQNPGGLDSALARPKQIYSYGGEKSDICSLAAAYAFGLARNHPFVDGNKRMSLMSISVFLGMNKYYLDAREEDAYQTMTKVADGSLLEEELTEWIRSNSFFVNTSSPK